MSTCAIQISGNYEDGEFISTCCETTQNGRRGICPRCYKELIKRGIIQDGDKFRDYPEWLQEMIRIQDSLDKQAERHPEILLPRPIG